MDSFNTPTESHIGSIVVTAGHVTIDWASRDDAPEQLTAGVRLILKNIVRNMGFYYREDMGVLAFPITAVEFYEK